ncbi:hypothetical protein JYG23_04115 [Sedimentibacter sp. zth1]|uniref:hypothetical protein n=1 Tax=Sedimentibacter sp. zth1 TaxID=2816908 RepID=UPI001A938FC8|nr:hypothetical protein [Sedimentibacter sp. zth1]QSX06648.1 hypothetical protein JYG23_04115 [Sedimentibacter sp. zth1]
MILKKLYSNLSTLISVNGRIFFIMYNNKPVLMNTELLNSIVVTLESIQLCIGHGNLSDAYTLLRKYRDDSFLFLYFLEIINNFDITSPNTKEQEHFYNWCHNNLNHLTIGKIFQYLIKNKDIKIIKK